MNMESMSESLQQILKENPALVINDNGRVCFCFVCNIKCLYIIKLLLITKLPHTQASFYIFPNFQSQS